MTGSLVRQSAAIAAARARRDVADRFHAEMTAAMTLGSLYQVAIAPPAGRIAVSPVLGGRNA